ncbi:uncharacterized protein Z520_01266 [Fonsecaea multimorphosa CBS 102226]|uniref:U3 small nucleolar RNA-associated protein 22 n=1 Tax=Fonsecaea multimorphosa CBS 102226 TaxID=1442371 RepID=A0A0D2HLN2_9EURO|nr:uncharacterized protein Z520_01266 [Fonsecaea multimorphosa CBS 102226]KIY02801.1 hypothetical protein Z520_01266 [Fonsecaea multimorphosa CBS 102226]OAL30966.1 hypothetical protein AYO22_01261 [Fonsecaea multimorphosa]
MSIENMPDGRYSAKRRKLSHDLQEDDVHLTEASPSPDDGGDGSHNLSRNGLASKGPPQKPAAKPAVLPTGGINKSAILGLQVADLDAEVTPNYDNLRSKWSSLSNKLVSLIKDIQDVPPINATDAVKSLRKQGISIPFPQPQPSKDTNYKFSFVPPKQVLVGGALPWSLSLKDENAIEITAIVPDGILQEKDYLNNRVCHKAAFYLACIASAIKNNEELDFSISFAHKHDIDLLPVIDLVAKDTGLSKFKFQIAVGFNNHSIPIAKTLPSKNCLRQEMLGSKEQSGTASPFYNSAIRYAASISAFDQLIRSTRSPSFDEACRIGQLWLRQRGFSSSARSGGFGFLEWTVVCALLTRTGGHRGHPLFSKQYSSIQFFKAMLQILGGRDLQEPMLLNGANFELPRSDVPVLYDGETGVNILYKMSPWSYASLRHHAQVSLAALNSRNQDGFDATFVLNVAVPLLQYDEMYSVKISGDRIRTPADQRQLVQRMHKVLQKGLGDRITLVDFKLPPDSGWPLNKDPPPQEEDLELQVALLTNPENVDRLVDRGPSADEQEEATEFREFWGEKAELRRFKDGSISESLVWTGDRPATVQIIAHLAALHFKLPPSSLAIRRRNLESSVLEDSNHTSGFTIKEAFRAINSTFQTLTSSLHNLEGLPLPIRSISPADAALRSSSTLHPLLPLTSSPIEIIVQFDSSTRWPDSLPAIQYTKIAFLLKLSELLSSNDPGLATRVGIENTESASTGYFNTSFLDIIYPSPAPGISPTCFRARIYHDREAHLIQTALADKSLHGALRDSLALALATYKRDFQAKPIHTTAIRNLITRFPPLSSTIRLLKKWVSSHLLLHEHIPEEILELIAAHIFLQPAPWSAPGSATTAFLRCLHFFSRWDWAYSPLMIDVSVSQDSLTAARIAEIQTRFEAWRKLDPQMNNVVWFVGTNVDTTGSVWTVNGHPPRVVAGRLTALARAAIGLIERKGTSMTEDEWNGLFESPLGDFDFLIHLKHSVVLRGGAGGLKAKRSKAKSGVAGGGEAEFKNLQIAESLDVDSIGYDPVELYLSDLNHAFGSAALFFYDRYGGGRPVIAGLWRPAVLGRKEWRVRLGWSSVPVKPEGEAEQGKDMCVFNRDGVLAEMARLGEGLVREIKVKE